MKRLIGFLIAMILLLLFMAGCSKPKVEAEEFKTLIDSEYVTVKYKGLAIEKDGKRYENFDRVGMLGFEITNHTNSRIMMHLDNLEIDGFQLEDDEYFMMVVVDPGQTESDARIVVLDKGTGVFPKFKKEANFDFTVINTDYEEGLEEYSINIEFDGKAKDNTDKK